MKGLAECNPDKNLQSNKDAFIEELLRERACELGMEDARFFDLIRYKRADIFEKQLHGLFIYRLDDNGVRRDLPWRGNDEGKMGNQSPRARSGRASGSSWKTGSTILAEPG